MTTVAVSTPTLPTTLIAAGFRPALDARPVPGAQPSTPISDGRVQ
ncbi:hypothetical protein [Frankia gtarii]|nr:hypothetical protein [Frankia gtarii]